MANHPWRQGAMTQAVPLLAAWVKTPNWIQTSYIPKPGTHNSWPLDLPIGTIGRSAQRGSTTSPENETPSKLYQPTTGICYISAKVYVELALGINWHQKGNNQMLTTTNAILYFTQMSPCFHQHKRRPMEASIKSFFSPASFFWRSFEGCWLMLGVQPWRLYYVCGQCTCLCAGTGQILSIWSRTTWAKLSVCAPHQLSNSERTVCFRLTATFSSSVARRWGLIESVHTGN
jgi:hypothetical protein